MGAELFIELVLGYRSAKIVFVAHGLGLFALTEEARTAGELARALAADERALLQVLRALCAIGLLRLDGERFANTPLASEHLLAGKPGYVGANLAYQELLWSGWSSLREIVSTGAPERGLVESLHRPEFTADYLKSVNHLSRGPAAEIMRLLGERPMARLLDVGGGLGAYARAFVDADPSRAATLLDLPPTLALTRAELADWPGRDRVTLTAGDYLDADFGGGFDLVLLSHVTHDEPDAVNLRLFEKARAALAPGGRVAVHDFVVDERGTGPLFSTLFSVNLLTYTRGGRVYSVAEYRALLERAGLREVTAREILPERNRSLLIVGEL